MHSEHNLGIYSTSICFDPHDLSGGVLPHLVESIPDTLCQTPNLTHLVLAINILNLIDLYQRLQHHSVPFSLHILESCFTPDLVPFLSAQSSIRTLAIFPSYSIPGHVSTVIEPLLISILPQLKSITTNPPNVIALLPGRPVTYVDTFISGQQERKFYECLKKSTASGGMECLSVNHPGQNFWTNVLGFLAPLMEICGRNLRELNIKALVLTGGQMQMVSQA